jgi:gliotoxin/aspirochlorine biosynthesis aminotransferase
MADPNGLSTRMSKSVASMLPHLTATISERMSKGPARIDLATSENWLLRPELVEICKDAIAQSLTADVSTVGFQRGRKRP